MSGQRRATLFYFRLDCVSIVIRKPMRFVRMQLYNSYCIILDTYVQRALPHSNTCRYGGKRAQARASERANGRSSGDARARGTSSRPSAAFVDRLPSPVDRTVVREPPLVARSKIIGGLGPPSSIARRRPLACSLAPSLALRRSPPPSFGRPWAAFIDRLPSPACSLARPLGRPPPLLLILIRI